MNNESLKPCPACGKSAGELIEDKAARFPFWVTCKSCPFMTEPAKLEAVAVKLWNEGERDE
jgi:hypothetical protein